MWYDQKTLQRHIEASKVSMYDAFGRWIGPLDQRDSLISSSYNAPVLPGDTTGEEDEDMTAQQTQAAKEGAALGAAFVALFGAPPVVDFKSGYTLAGFFAKAAGYRELDSGNEYIMAFVQALQVGTGQAPKVLASGNDE